ncbi:hypothetical protein [Amycolatopsis suaedae]|uniref:Uncharacterized protein n=1 Tax=Amycolatopsis suaedae TaxID=2510978 RepID=A0A4Q7JDF0_9PSEU|nr:hypothetical protein [Amycolatopsis suaedae]RZQ64663.1 hypothetical protein EWH70_07145 [Amycolatopsis suaedae]
MKFSDSTHIIGWKNGRITDYGSFSSRFGSIRVYDQNRAGTIVGSTTAGAPSIPPRITPFRTTGTGTETLPALTGATMTFPSAGINDKGDIAGGSRTSRSSPITAIRWPASKPGTVEKIPGAPETANIAGLDEDGTVLVNVPESSLTQQRPHFLKDGKLTALGKTTPNGDLRGESVSAGRVVGSLYYQNSAGQWVEDAVFWNTDGVARKLPNGETAVDINRDGLSAGVAKNGQAAVWRLGALDATLGADTVANTVGDDGAVAGSRKVNGVEQPTVWRCS